MSSSKNRIVVLGAGPVGSLLSCFLGRRGHEVRVFERRPDMRTTEIPAGRSINLACSDRGFKALDAVGIGARVKETAIPMKGRMLHAVDGQLTLLPYGKPGQAIYAISRGLLNMELMTFAETQPGVSFSFNQRCGDVDLDADRIELVDEVSGQRRTIDDAEVVFGADGAFSALRSAMVRTDRFDYSQSYVQHGYKELTIPPTASGEFAMDPGALHIWPRGELMLIALPNTDRTFTCTLFLPFSGEGSFEQLSTREAVEALFSKTFPDAAELMPTLLDDFFANPTSSLVTVRCYPWVVADRYALIGDAAHAVVPFYGQGMNAGFEDCDVLADCIDEHVGDWPAILADYQQRRKANADAIADLALRNFVEMRDTVRDPVFQLKKKIGARLHQLEPERFVPVYSMVTFSHIPYAEALARGDAQDELLERLAAQDGIERQLDSGAADDRLRAALSSFEARAV